MLNKKNSIFPLIILIFFALPCPLKASEPEGPLEEYNQTRPYFGAYFTVHCRYDKKLTDIGPVMEKCWRKLDEVQVNMNADSTQGFLGMINRAGPNNGVQVSDDLYRIIGDAVAYSRRTENAFDITVHPLVQLWKRAAKNDRLPTQSEIDVTLQSVGCKFIRLDPANTIVLTRPGMRLDLNAIAPAFAVDRIAQLLDENKVEHYMVDGSGEIRCKGDQLGQQGWRVGERDGRGVPRRWVSLGLDGALRHPRR